MRKGSSGQGNHGEALEAEMGPSAVIGYGGESSGMFAFLENGMPRFPRLSGYSLTGFSLRVDPYTVFHIPN
jgi:hypothetical protein